MKLLIDLGNSNIKWCFSGAGEVQTQPHLGDAQAVCYALEQAGFDFDTISSAWLCSVADPELTQAVVHFLSPRVNLKQVSVTSEAAGVRCAYEDQARLGVDRWMCLLAAHHLYADNAVLVVDIGTAVTLDAVLASGEHLGGQIIPGVEMMQQSLGRGTAQVGFVSSDPGPPAWFGQTTAQGVDSGTRRAIACLIEASHARLLSDYDPNAILLLTGGGVEMIKPLISGTMRSEPALVFQGLSLIAGDE